MRVLALTNGWPTDAAPEYCVFNRRQVEDIRRLGVDVDVHFINARERGRGQYLRTLPVIAREAASHDIVHCFHGLSFLTACLGRVRTPMVISYLNAIDNEFADLPPALRRIATGLSKRIVLGPGSHHGVIFKDRVPADLAGRPLIRCIPNGINLELFRPGAKVEARRELGLDPEATYLLFVSSKDLMRPQKRYDRFQRVVDACRRANPDSSVHELHLVSQPEDVVLRTYRAADALVLTSDYEGSPNAVKEALATGLPVVATDVGNVREMIDGLQATRVIAPFSEEAFVTAIDAVRSASAEARAELRDAILARGLDSGSAARKVLDLYEAVLAARA